MSKLIEDSTKYKKILREGSVLAIDPSSTSIGYAVFNKGALMESGCKKYSGAIHKRFFKLYQDIYYLAQNNFCDLLVIERLRPSSTASRKVYTKHQLLWSVGVVIAAAGLPFIEVSPNSWKATQRDKDLDKTDENDAICIGYTPINLARDI